METDIDKMSHKNTTKFVTIHFGRVQSSFSDQENNNLEQTIAQIITSFKYSQTKHFSRKDTTF